MIAEEWRDLALRAADTIEELAQTADFALERLEQETKERRRVGTLDMRLRRVVRMLRKILSDETLKELEAGLTDDPPHSTPPSS